MDNFKQDNIRRTEAEKEAWSNKFVADATNNNLDHVVTLKYMNLLLQFYTPSKCPIYNNWTVHEHKCLSSFLFFRFPSNWEREGVYKIWYKETQSQGYLSDFFDGVPVENLSSFTG